MSTTNGTTTQASTDLRPHEPIPTEELQGVQGTASENSRRARPPTTTTTSRTESYDQSTSQNATARKSEDGERMMFEMDEC